jgi:thiol-disulfide isomerase/thioredoxin
MKPKAFNFLRLAALLGLLLIVASCDPADRSGSNPQQVNLKDLQGQWLVINYWAVWCKPCIEEIPELNSFAHQYSQQVRVFGVNFDGISGKELSAASTLLGIDFPTLATDPASQLGYERPSVLPTTIVINPQGQLHKILLGPQTAASLSQAIVGSLPN